MRFPISLLTATTLVAFVAFPATAADESGTLNKVKESGSIVLGYRDSSIPFSYLGSDQKPVGYSWEIANAVVDRVKKELNMPNLEVKTNLVTSQTRIPLVQNGTVDLECGSTTNNVERQRQVDFSVGFFSANTRLLTRKTTGIKDFPDLKNKTVVVTAGSTSERILKAMNLDKYMSMNIISAKDIGESFMMLESGRSAAYMVDDVLLAGDIAKSRNPDEWLLTGTPQSTEIYGCMMRKGDPAFKKLVDDTIKGLFKSGEINRIYAKWFQSPIPPRGINMRFPMSPNLKALIAKPNDKAAEQL